MLDGDAPVVDLLADPQPPGRRGRVPRRAPQAMGDGRRPAQGRQRSTTGCCEPQTALAQRRRGSILGYRCANSRDDDRRRRRPRASTPTTTSRADRRADDDLAQDGLPRRTPKPGEPITHHQVVAYHTSRGRARRASSSTAAARTLDRARRRRRRRASSPSSASGSTRSGRAPTSRSSTASDDAASRRSAGTCSSSPRRRRAPSSTASPAKGVTGSRLRGPLLLGHRDLRRCRS